MRRVFTCFPKSLIFIFITGFFFLNKTTGQNNCVPIAQPITQNLSLGCGANCTDLTISVPHIKQTSDYVVQSIPYAPRPFTTPTGIELPSLYTDDVWSTLQTIPFNICFYDSTYNTFVVGSNGLITFDAANQTGGTGPASCGNAWFLSPGEPIPFIHTTSPCTVGQQSYYPKASIMGVYQDSEPGILTGHADQKIEYRIEGVAPCRALVVSFNNLAMFSCTTDTATSQIVVHEGTGIIEIFVKRRMICTTWNPSSPPGAGGLGILGIQNYYRNKAVAAPGKNDQIFTITNEAWRFLPVGGPSRFVKSQLLFNNMPIALADTSTVTPNELLINFPNVCPATITSQYVIRTEFVNCTDPNNPLTRYDTVNITKTAALPGSTVPTATACGGTTGAILVTALGGVAPFTFTLTGPGGPYTPQVSATDNTTFTGLPGGNFTINITDALGCTGSTTAFVDNVLVVAGSYSTTPGACPGVNNGQISITPSLGAAAGPYTFTLTGPGGPYVQTGIPSTVVFTGLAGGTYDVSFTNGGCTGVISNMVVSPGAAPSATISHVNTSCSSSADGSVTVTPSGGTAGGPYTVTLNPGAIVQTGVATSAVFTGLPTGTYTATYTTPTGCNGSSGTTTIGSGTTPTALIDGFNTSCPGATDGIVTVSPTGGAAQGPYTVTLLPINIVQTGVISVATFTGLPSGIYHATFSNGGGCLGTTTNLSISNGPGVAGSSVPQSTSCPTRNDGTITVTAGGTGPFVYTLNPGNIVQNNNPVFTGLAPGTYNITFTTASGCGGTVTPNPVVTAGPFLTATATPFNPPCANINNGTITIVPGGVAPYSYTLTGPGGPYTQTTATFNNLAAGTYNYSFTDGVGCTGTGGPVTLTTNTALGITVTLTQPLCNGGNTGSITLAASGGVPVYSYSRAPFTVSQPTGTFGGLTAGTYTFRVTDNVSCTKDTTVTLGEPTLLTASASSPSTAGCDGNDGTIAVVGAGGTLPYQYSIDNGVTYQPASTFVAPAVGAYPNILVKDANGCIANTSATVGLVDNMFLNIGNDTTICVESSITFNPQTNTNTSVFVWRPLDAVATLPSTIANNLIKNAVATPTDTATYILHAEWGACVREDTILVRVLHKPIPDAGLDTAICNRTYAILRGTATNLSGTVNYAWSPADSVLVPTDAVTIASPDTTQLYTLTVTDNYGCNFSVTDQVLITLQPPVPAFAGNDTIAIKGVPHQLFGSGGVDYLWNPAGPLSFSNIQNPLATLNNDQLFILKVTDVAGCIGYDTVFIQVYEGPNYYVPNAFSPNGDGLNDVFRPIPVGMAKTEYFRVFNRYGELVFETNQWLKGWDGRYKGKLQPIGNYVWVVKGLDKNGRIIEMKGTVLIVQ